MAIGSRPKFSAFALCIRKREVSKIFAHVCEYVYLYLVFDFEVCSEYVISFTKCLLERIDNLCRYTRRMVYVTET